MSRKESLRQATTNTAAMQPGGPPRASLSRKEIAALAYSYWEARGYQDGSSEQDWLQAERDLRDRQSQGSVQEKRISRTMKQAG